MRVLLAHDYGAPVGGAELAQFALRDDLRALGHDARLFASSAAPRREGMSPDYECFGTMSRFRTLLQTANPWASASLARVLDEFRPDVVQVGMFLTQLSPLILGRLGGVPSVYYVHWLRPICPTGSKVRPDGSACHSAPDATCLTSGCLPARDWPALMLQMKLWRARAGAFDAVVTSSEFMRARLAEGGISPVEVIPYDIPKQAPPAPLAACPAVGFAGRLVPEKGADLLLRAFARATSGLPGARLLVAGDGPERPRLERLAAGLGIAGRVEFLGHVARDRVGPALASVWVHVVPSMVEEAFGLTAAEAMARGTAVVAARAGGLSEVVGDAGRLVPMGDEAALALALREILTDRGLAERLGRLGLEAARARGGRGFAGSMAALFERVVSGGGAYEAH